MTLTELKNNYIQHLAEESGMTRADAITLGNIDRKIQKTLEDQTIADFIQYIYDRPTTR